VPVTLIREPEPEPAPERKAHTHSRPGRAWGQVMAEGLPSQPCRGVRARVCAGEWCLERSGGAIAVLIDRSSSGLNLPFGLHAAITVVRVLSLHTSPACECAHRSLGAGGRPERPRPVGIA
jgi:hypothetical protein